jgi:hypothetical protein
MADEEETITIFPDNDCWVCRKPIRCRSTTNRGGLVHIVTMHPQCKNMHNKKMKLEEQIRRAESKLIDVEFSIFLQRFGMTQG